MNRPLLAFAVLTCALTWLGCGVPLDEAPADVVAVEQELRNCPPTHPDYPACPPPVVERCEGISGSITASPASIPLGQTTRVSWSVRFPTGCNQQVKLSGLSVAASGSQVFTPMASQAFRLTAGPFVIGSTSVAVSLPSVVRIKGSDHEWRRLLLQAVGTANTRVVLENQVDMDMTGVEGAYIAQGVTLTSEGPPIGAVLEASAKASTSFSGVAAMASTATPFALAATKVNVASVGGALEPPLGRNAHNIGPRLYTTSKPRPLFNIRCNGVDIFGDNVRLLGFRLQGPHWDTADGDDNLEVGVIVDSCLNVEIAHMELSGWSGSAISVRDSIDRHFNPSAVSVHDNFIHHNQHSGGNGYGVVVGGGGYAGIERNVFDFNRHAIAASGAPGVGYRANLNLVLRGGGRHDKWYNEYTHQFDVHGDANCPDIPGNQHTWNCGNAGDQFWFTANAFQYSSDNAIKIRGVPRVQAVIDGNVFPHDDLDDAVNTKSDVHIWWGQNTTDVQTYGHYGVCDFDGDGKEDLFLATGASWWYSSGAKSHWIFLSDARERLHQVGLGDFDGDKRCDVLAAGAGGWVISKGGTGAWTALPGISVQPLDQLRFHDFNADGVTDLFHRDGNGQWWLASPGRFNWTALQSSAQALSDLRFGDFNGDRVTDVLGRSGGKWAVSWGGATSWQQINPTLGDSLSSTLIGNVDGIAGDDVIRVVVTGSASLRFDVSSGGATPWQTLASVSWPSGGLIPPVASVIPLVGQFDAWAGDDLLTIDHERMTRIFSLGHTNFTSHSFYAR